MERSSGILMHITSLPSPYGIGTLGKEAYAFADFLKAAGQKHWQVLPINPTGYGDSPYQAFSTFAGNPYMIDLDTLAAEGLLQAEEYQTLNWGDDPENVDFGKVYVNKMHVLRIAKEHAALDTDDSFREFCELHNWWLHDYAVYMAAKSVHQNLPWNEWHDEGISQHNPEAIEQFERDYADEVAFWKFVQHLFFKQWFALKAYVNNLGIDIIGDIPFYVSADSSDVWAGKHLFRFDEDMQPSAYAGVPPDYFSADGQYWGNPIFNWDHLRETGYNWWVERLAHMMSLYDMIRIDHFRGFEAFYAIDKGAETAAHGHWIKGPGIDFFRAVEQRLGHLPLIAEDLGFLTQEVHELRKEAGFPGMKVLQFAFNPHESSDYLPHRFDFNCAVYTGTHDNATLRGWFEEARIEEVEEAVQYAALTEQEGYNWGMIRLMYGSVANIAIAQMQDFLDLPGGARMNTPSTLGGNWQWRLRADAIPAGMAEKIAGMVRLYGRS